MVRKGGNGAYCCDASRVNHDDAHAFTNYVSPSLAEIGALGDEGGIRRCTGPGSYLKRSEKIVSHNSDHKIRERTLFFVVLRRTTDCKTLFGGVLFVCVLTADH